MEQQPDESAEDAQVQEWLDNIHAAERDLQRARENRIPGVGLPLDNPLVLRAIRRRHQTTSEEIEASS